MRTRCLEMLAALCVLAMVPLAGALIQKSWLVCDLLLQIY
jgi:hypothetical protein